MHPKEPRRIAMSLDIIPFARVPDAPTWLACTLCREQLALSQPDLQSPDHLVGVCEGCQRWHLIQLEPAGGEAILVVLPGWELFNAAAEARDAEAGHDTTKVNTGPGEPES